MVIDAHMHLVRYDSFDHETYARLGWIAPPDVDLDQQIKWWKEAGIVKQVSMGQDMKKIWNTSFDGDYYVNEAYKRYPDFIIPFSSVEPIDKADRFNQEAYDRLERDILENNVKGVLLTPPYGHYKANDKCVYPFYQLAQKHGIVMQYHHSAMDGCPAVFCPTEYCQMTDLNDVAIDFPKMKMVVEHLGYPWTEHLYTIMANSDRIYSDLAMAYDREMATAWSLVLAREYGVLDKIMFATDFLTPDYYPYSKNPVEDVMRNIEKVRHGFNEINKRCGWPLLTEEEIDGILYKNAARLYELDLSEQEKTNE